MLLPLVWSSFGIFLFSIQLHLLASYYDHLVTGGTYEADVFLCMHDLKMCWYVYMCCFANDKVMVLEQRRDRVRFRICFVFDF